MKKILKYLLVFIVLFSFFLPVNAKEDDKITLYLFYGDGCPHCAEEKLFLDENNVFSYVNPVCPVCGSHKIIKKGNIVKNNKILMKKPVF